MADLIKCCQCLSRFNLQRLPRKLPQCSHSVCRKCIDQLIQTESQILICGFCESTVSAKNFTELEENINLILKLPLNLEKNDVFSRGKADNDEIILTQTEPSLFGGQTCNIHNKPNDIVCISDRRKICSHCALFGTHKHHQFIRLEDFESSVAHKYLKLKELKQKVAKMPIKNSFNTDQFIRTNLNIKKQHLKVQIENEFQKLSLKLRQKKQKLVQQLQKLYDDLFQKCKKNEEYCAFRSKIRQFQKYEEEIKSKVKIFNKSIFNLEEKIDFFYEKDFESKFNDQRRILEITNHYEDYRVKIKEVLNNVVIKSNEEVIKQLDLAITISNKNRDDGFISISESISNLSVNSKRQSSIEDTDSGTYTQGKKKTIQNEANLSRYTTPKKVYKSTNNEEEEKPKTAMTQSNLHLKKSGYPRNFNDYKVKMSQSQLVHTKSPLKHTKSPSIKDLKSVQIQRTQNVQKTQTIYLQFSKNKLTDTFDISDCQLSNDNIVEYVHRARRIHKIRTLKIANNYLNPSGFEKMTEYLQGVSFINLVNNKLDETVIDIIYKCKHNLQSVKIINLSNNPINLDNKRMIKIQQIKKNGIVLIL